MTRKRLERIVLYLTVIITCFIVVFPLYWMFNTSLAPRTEVWVYPPRFIHPNAQLDSYRAVLFGERPMFLWLRNSAIVAISATILTMIISVPAAYSLSRYSVPGTQSMGVFILTSRMLPSTLLVIPLFVFLRQLGVINDLRSVIIADTTFIIPFAIWMLKGYFDSVPRELEEAAMIDGCNPLSALMRVILPIAGPGLAATTLYSIVLSWNEFLFAKTFLSSDSVWTVTVGLSSFKGEYITYWNEVMAASLVATIPIVFAFLFLENFLVSGLTAGAAK